MGKVTLSHKQTIAYDIAHANQKQFILYGGAIRGGKTWWLLITFISFCSRWPKSRWVIVRESLPRLQATTFVSFHSILNTGLASFVAHHDKQQHIYTFKNGSQIIFFAENYDNDKDLDRFKGLECNGFGAEEINELQEKTFFKMFERAGSWNGADADANGILPNPKILATCNPAHNWVKTLVYDPWRQRELNPNWDFISANINDNPHLQQSYKDSLMENMPEVERLRFVEGDWDIMQVVNAFAYEYKQDKHEGTVEFDPAREVHISIDFNLNPFGIIFSHVYYQGRQLCIRVFDEMSIENGSLPIMAERIKARYAEHLRKFNITGDAMGNNRNITMADNASNYIYLQRALKLKPHQIIVPANPAHSNSRADVNFVLHNADVKIDPVKCPNLCRDLKFVQCDAFGEIIKRDRKDINQRADHLDCFRYLVNTWAAEYIAKTKNW